MVKLFKKIKVEGTKRDYFAGGMFVGGLLTLGSIIIGSSISNNQNLGGRSLEEIAPDTMELVSISDIIPIMQDFNNDGRTNGAIRYRPTYENYVLLKGKEGLIIDKYKINQNGKIKTENNYLIKEDF